MSKQYCRECGGLMQIDQHGISNHLLDPKPAGRLDDVDYSTDRDHVAVADIEDALLYVADVKRRVGLA